MKKKILFAVALYFAVLVSAPVFSGDPSGKKSCSKPCAKQTAMKGKKECTGEMTQVQFFDAVRAGKVGVVKAALEKDAKWVDVKNNKGFMAIHWAAGSKNKKMLNLFLEKGQDINAENSNGGTPIFLAVRNNACIDFVNYMVEKGAVLNTANNDGYTPLHYASLKGNTPVINACINSGIDVNTASTNYQVTPLHWAVWSDSVSAVKTLIMKGAKVNAVNTRGYTPLMGAVQAKSPMKAKVLLKNQADINKINKQEVNALFLAVSYGNPKIVGMLIHKGGNINVKHAQTGATPLHIASQKGYNTIAQKLIENGADVNATDNNKHTPNHYASMLEYKNLSAMLVSSGAKPVKIKNQQSTPFVLASYSQPEASNVWHLGHAGWAVKSGNNLLVFDYYQRGFQAEEPSLANGNINPEEIKDMNVYVFVTHDHGDHHDKAIYAWDEKIENITYVYGFNAAKSKLGEKTANVKSVCMKPHATQTIDKLKVSTLKSNDSGVGFLVNVNGTKIYHGGDHAARNANLMEGYTKEIDYIAEKADNKVDIAFLSVVGCGAWKEEPIQQGFVYTIEKLNPEFVFPQHAGDNYSRYEKFNKIAKEHKAKTKVMAAEYKGMRFDVEGDVQLSSNIE